MKVFVVIPNLNGADFLQSCLESLQNQTQTHEVVIVDNNSTDNSVYIIEEYFPSSTLLKLHKNHGFAGGVNKGISYALENGADAVALFNNDAVADKNWLKKLVKTMESTQAGIVTCKLMRDDKRHFDSTGDFYSVYGIAFPRGRNKADKGQYDKSEEVFGASGGASLYSAKMLKEIGLFDERFFAYFEDIDISFRARLAGWKIFYEPESIAYHRVSGTSSKMGDFTRYHSIKNFLILYTKNMPTNLYWKYLPRFLYQFTRTTAKSLLDLKPHVWLKAVIIFLAYLPDIIWDRYHIQKNRQLSNSEVESLLSKNRPPKIPTI